MDDKSPKAVTSAETTQPTPQAVLPGPIALVQEAWGILMDRIVSIVCIFLVGIVGAGVLIGLLVGLAALVGFVLSGQVIVSTTLIVVISVLGAIVYSVSLAWIQLALIYSIVFRKEKYGIKAVYKNTWGKIISYWWIHFLMGIIVLCGYLLFIIPGFIFAVWFSFAVYIMLVEKEKGLNALLKSREYVRGKFWPVVGRMLAPILPFILFFLLFPVISFITNDSSLLRAIEPIISLLNIALAPFFFIYHYLLYEKLKAVKGEFAFQPTKRQRVPYIIMAVLGVLIPVLIFVGMTVFLSTIYQDGIEPVTGLKPVISLPATFEDSGYNEYE